MKNNHPTWPLSRLECCELNYSFLMKICILKQSLGCDAYKLEHNCNINSRNVFPHLCSIWISHSIQNYEIFTKKWIFCSHWFLSDLTEATSQQAKEVGKAGEESEGRFERGLMNNRHWSEQNSVARQLIIPAAHKNRFQGLLCHASAVGWWGMGVIRVGGSGGSGLNRWTEDIIRYAYNSFTQGLLCHTSAEWWGVIRVGAEGGGASGWIGE